MREREWKLGVHVYIPYSGGDSGGGDGGGDDSGIRGTATFGVK